MTGMSAMIKVEIGDTIFYCDSACEAADLATLMGRKNGVYRKNVPKSLVKENGEMSSFVQKIKDLPSTSVTSETLCEALGLESVNGLGPKMRGYAKRFEQAYDQPLKSVLESVIKPGQPTVWKIHKNALERMVDL